MTLDFDICYKAMQARDPRFDGTFFTGVRTTGIYCRSICHARTPLASSCRFFGVAAAAEAAGFRPCLRCRPELAPGVNQVHFADALFKHLRESAPFAGMSEIARKSGVSERQMRRIVVEAFGVTPVQIRQTERLLLAKRLLQETRLPVSQIGLSAGFQSLRRFNHLFKERYRFSPMRFREQLPSAPASAAMLTLKLSYRPPFAWLEMLAYLSRRAMPSVEFVDANSYSRVVSFGSISDVIQVSNVPGKDFLTLSLPAALVVHVPEIMSRLRSLLDLDASPQLIASHLTGDVFLKKSLAKVPGLRVPGAWCGFELAIRAILGQQVSVAGATTLAGRLVQAFGKPADTSHPHLQRVFFDAATLANASLSQIQGIGLPKNRAAALQNMARAFSSGDLTFPPGTPTAAIREKLLSLPGIGPWTADYLLLRVWRDPDAFPSGDLALRKAAGGISAKELTVRSQAWRPWRAYAALHLWQSLSTTPL